MGTQGFALAEGWDGQNYTGLVLPTDSASRPATVDALLLMDPRRVSNNASVRSRRDHPNLRPLQNPGPAHTSPASNHPGAGNHRPRHRDR